MEGILYTPSVYKYKMFIFIKTMYLDIYKWREYVILYDMVVYMLSHIVDS
jgi:hypothetical protein